MKPLLRNLNLHVLKLRPFFRSCTSWNLPSLPSQSLKSSSDVNVAQKNILTIAIVIRYSYSYKI